MGSIRSFSRLILGSLGIVTILTLMLASSTLAQRIRPNIPAGGGTTPQSNRPPSMDESVQVMVELSDAPAAVTWAAAHKKAQAQLDAERAYALQNPTLPASQALLRKAPQQAKISPADAAQIKSIKDNIDQKQHALMSSLTGGSIGGKVIFRAQMAYNGIAMVVSPKQISAIAALPGVKAVHPMNPKYLVTTFSDIDFLNTRPAWTTGPLGTHGENIKVADIDTGLDYIHTNFGGSGSTADYSSTNDTSAVPNANFPTQKVSNGTDLVGDNYNASGSGSQLIPVPDNNPLDCNGHGTATASLIGGFGVTNGGFTYAGNYDASSPNISALKIPPGFAPAAKVIPVRVFGCAGSTNVVVQAIEWAMTQGTGDPANRVDVINMSLGSNEGFADDPDDIAASNAAAAGILVCSAAGNAGDSYYIHSSPAAAVGTLGVAATFNNQKGFIYDSTITGNQPASFAGQEDFTIFTTTSPHSGATGNVVYAINAPGPTGSTHDGSHPLTNAVQVSGNVCLVDRVSGQGANASVNCQNAGAIGIIDIADFATGGGNPFLLTTSPALHTPMVVCSPNYGAAIKSNAMFDSGTGVSTSTPPLNVTISGPFNAVDVQPANPPGSPAGAGSTDTVASYSSRGPGLPDSSTKPDIAAPAEVTAVAQSAADKSPVPAFAGNAVENFNGTSSATPHVSGMMALLRQLHPNWSVQEILALGCNTATHDLFTTEQPSTPSVQYGVGRVGAGRIDVGNAARATAVAFNGTDADGVGVSFGVVETPVSGSSTLTKKIQLENKGTTKLKYKLTFQSVTPVAGANFTFGANSITIQPGATTTIPVTFNATGSALKHARETSVADNQLGLPRQWVTETGGYAVFAPSDGSPTLRVELYAAIKPASAMHTRTKSVSENGASTGSFTLNVNGAAVNTGPNLGEGFDILSLVKAFELQYAVTSPSSNDRLKIKYVGVTSDYVNHAAGADKSNTLIMFGAEKFGDAATPDFASSDTEIIFDTNPADIGVTFNPNYQVFLGNIGQAFGVAGAENVFTTILVNLATNSITAAEDFTNGLDASQADTNIYNNSGIAFPIFATDIGLIGGSGTGNTKFQYAVITFDRNGAFVDASNILTYDLANPGLEVENSAGAHGVNTVPAQSAPFFEPFWYQDVTKNSIPVNYNRANFLNNGSLGVWLFHTHNGNGNRSDVVTVTP
jgi:subtilisin family serine protease